MNTLSFTRNADGRNEATFTAGSVNILQILVKPGLPSQSNSLSVFTRVSADMPWALVKLYVPVPSHIVNLPVHPGELVQLVTDLDVTQCGIIITESNAGGSNISDEDLARIVEQIEQNRRDIDAQQRINDKQQEQIDKNTEVNVQQEITIKDKTEIAPPEAITDLFK